MCFKGCSSSKQYLLVQFVKLDYFLPILLWKILHFTQSMSSRPYCDFIFWRFSASKSWESINFALMILNLNNQSVKCGITFRRALRNLLILSVSSLLVIYRLDDFDKKFMVPNILAKNSLESKTMTKLHCFSKFLRMVSLEYTFIELMIMLKNQEAYKTSRKQLMR